MSKNKTPHPYMYMRFDKPSKWDWIQGGQWHISRLEYLRLHENQWIPSPFTFSEEWEGFYKDYNQIVWRAFAIPPRLFEPSGYNCPCVLEPVHSQPKVRRLLTEKELLSSMRLSLILVKGGLITWERFFELHPLALDYIEIRLVYQDYIMGLILKAPKRLWNWLRRKRK